MNNKLSTVEKELYHRVDEILHYIWDPIGVSDNPTARDEYHSYLPRVFKLVVDESKEYEIAAYLTTLESGSMGLSANQKKAIEVARLLLDTRDAIFE